MEARVKYGLLILTVLSLGAGVALAAEESGPTIREGGQLGELRTFTASGLSSSGTLLFTSPATGWFTITEVCANPTKSDQRDVNVIIQAGATHLATIHEPQGGLQPKCVQFGTGVVLPPSTPVTCEGGSGHSCWVTGICSRKCELP
jgi:hypothetical protein